MAGQPTKYKPEYCDKILVHMNQGLSFESFAATIGVHRETLYEWGRRHTAFSDAIKKGKELSLLYWEKLGLMAVHGKVKGFQCAVYIFTMKNRFGWRDALDVQGKFKTETSKADPKAALKKKRAENQARLDEIKKRT